MAHRITYKPSGIILSSAVGDIGIEVDGSYVDVTLTAPGNIVILSERYYAYGSRVMLYDIATLIEAEMRNAGYSVANFTLRVFTDTVANKADSWTLHVLYCDRYAIGNDIPNFLLENFLTTLPVRRLAFNSGSDKRELYTIAQALQKPYHDLLFTVHRIIIRFNGWQGVHPEIPFIQLTTLDEHQDAKQVKLPNTNDNATDNQ